MKNYNTILDGNAPTTEEIAIYRRVRDYNRIRAIDDILKRVGYKNGLKSLKRSEANELIADFKETLEVACIDALDNIEFEYERKKQREDDFAERMDELYRAIDNITYSLLK